MFARKWCVYKVSVQSTCVLRDIFGKLETQREDGATVNEARPLSGLDVLDVGCGGGLLSEVRARM